MNNAVNYNKIMVILPYEGKVLKEGRDMVVEGKLEVVQ